MGNPGLGKYYTISKAGVVAHNTSKRVKHDPADWIVQRDVWPPIIPRPLWTTVSRRTRSNKSCANSNEAFLLSSRLRCTACDAPMYGRTMRHTKNRRYEGLTVKDRFGQTKGHPAVEIERQSLLAFVRIRRELGLNVEPPDSRPPLPRGYR